MDVNACFMHLRAGDVHLASSGDSARRRRDLGASSSGTHRSGRMPAASPKTAEAERLLLVPLRSQLMRPIRHAGTGDTGADEIRGRKKTI